MPGSGGALGIIIHKKFECKFILKSNSLIIDRIKGLDADIPGPFNPDINRIKIQKPNHIEIVF